jgi:hypothetical protein
VTPLLVRIHIIVVLVLNLLVLLLQLSLVLLHLRRSVGIVTHIVHVHLNIHIVLRRSPLLLGRHHHLMWTHRLIGIHSVRVAILNMLPTHRLPIVVHE